MPNEPELQKHECSFDMYQSTQGPFQLCVGCGAERQADPIEERIICCDRYMITSGHETDCQNFS